MKQMTSLRPLTADAARTFSIDEINTLSTTEEKLDRIESVLVYMLLHNYCLSRNPAQPMYTTIRESSDVRPQYMGGKRSIDYSKDTAMYSKI